MDQNAFQDLIGLDEGATLEFKKSLSDSTRICETICAFANTGGGRIVFGIHKQGKTSVLAGIENTDKDTGELANWIRNNLRPQIRYVPTTITLDGKHFIILNIDALPLTEVCTYNHKVFQRKGATNQEVSGTLLILFLRERGLLSFEELPSSATVADLDTKKVHTLIRARGTEPDHHKPINIETALASLGVASLLDKLVIKKSAPIFFAKDVPKFQGNCEVRIVKFRGKESALEFREYDKRFIDTIPELLRTSFDNILAQLGTVSVIVDGRRQEIPAIPPNVIREVITNAIGHRDYIDPNCVLVEIFDDRIQVTNPGGLLPGQTLKNFVETRRHRNPIIHRLLNDAGWGEGLCFGIKLIYRELRKNSLPDPEFQDLGGFFRVVLYTARSDKKRKPADHISERQAKALAYLEKHEIIRSEEYARIVGISKVTAVKDLNELVIQGRIRKIGKFRGAHYIKP